MEAPQRALAAPLPVVAGLNDSAESLRSVHEGSPQHVSEHNPNDNQSTDNPGFIEEIYADWERTTMDADCARLLAAYAARGSLRFADFRAVWAEGGYSELHTVVTAFASDTGVAYQQLYAHLFSYLSQRRPVAVKAGVVYAVYTLFCTQPNAPEPARVGPHEWQRLRVLYGLFAGAGAVGRDLCAVISRLCHGGALLLAAYSGPVSFVSIAQAARLYGLGELAPAADPTAPLVDHLREVLGGGPLVGGPGSPPPASDRAAAPSKRRRSKAAQAPQPSLTALIDADDEGGDGEGGSGSVREGSAEDEDGEEAAGSVGGLRRPERDSYAVARSRALGAAVFDACGRSRQASLPLDAVLGCAAARAGGGGDVALVEAAVRGATAPAGEDVAGRPDAAEAQRVPIAFPARPSPLFPGVAGRDWAAHEGGAGGGGEDGSSAYDSLREALRVPPKRRPWRVWPSLSDAGDEPWPPPVDLLYDHAALLGGAVAGLRITEGDGGAQQQQMQPEKPPSGAKGRKAAEAAAAVAAMAPTAPLRDVPYVESLDLGAADPGSAVGAAAVARLRALLRETLVRGLVIEGSAEAAAPAEGGGGGAQAGRLPPPEGAGAAFDGEEEEQGALAAGARLRLARETWSNLPADAARGGALAGGGALRDRDPAALSRLLRQSFAELREPAPPLLPAPALGPGGGAAAGDRDQSRGALVAAAGAAEPPKKKPRGRNAAMARLRQQE